MPRVLMVTGEYPPLLGGVADYTAVLVQHLARLGIELQVLTGARGETPATAGGCAPVSRIRGGWGAGSWREVSAAARSMDAGIVHIQYQAAAYGMSGAVNLLPGYLRRALPEVRTVTTFHDLRVPYLFPKAGPLRRGSILALDRLSHATVVTNGADLEDLGGRGNTEHGSPRRWLIPLASSVPNSQPPGYDRELWRRSRLGSAGTDLVLAYFGFLNASKGVDVLTEALAVLRERGVPARVVIVGGEAGDSDPTNREYSERVRHVVQTSGMSPHVVWTGFSSPEEVSAHLAASDICVLPFLDGASLRRSSLLAAVAHGLPTVTTRPERPEPLLRDGENVVLVERGAPRAIADACEALLHDVETRRRLVAGATELAGRFRWTEIASQHHQLYRTLPAAGR